MLVTPHKWYLVHSQPNAEQRVVDHLTRQGFQTYLPRYKKTRRHARRTEVIKAPLFPRYIFINLDLATQRWRSVMSTFGVSRLICNGELPSQVPDEVIAELKARENDAGLVQLNLAPRFRAGEKVRIINGAFVECLGLFEGMRDNDRVAVLLELLGRKVRVSLESDYLTAA